MSVRSIVLVLGLLVATAGLTLVFSTPGSSEEGDASHIVYLNVTGDGPNAKAWYHGAPPAGVMIQDALDDFSAKGYRVAEVRPYQRQYVTVVGSDGGSLLSPTEREEYFIILLEKTR